MWERFSGWAVTSPLAFALAAVVDLCAFALSTMVDRWAPGRGSRRR